MFTGFKYKSLRMLRLRYVATNATEQFEIINEFKLQEEYKIINELRIQKEATEKFIVKFKTEIDLNKQCNLSKEIIDRQEKELDAIEAKLIEINNELAKKDSEKLSTPEYYEKLHEILFDKKVSFDEIDLAATNKAYKDFFLSL